MPKLTLRVSDDWFVIERAEHDGRSGLAPIAPGVMGFWTSARISDADVEGDCYEMLGIALAIEQRSAFSAKRCAVRVDGDRVEFWSPRNSMRHGEASLAEADELAKAIRERLADALCGAP